MQLDIRLPMGLLFLLLGLILVVYGFISADSTIYIEHSLGQNVNKVWGSIFALFGSVMLWLARRGKS